MRPWAEFFHEQGYSISVPLLPGHGTEPADLNRVKWQEWPAKVQEEFEWMQSQGMQIFIFGLSMGGATTLNVAMKKLPELKGIVLANPMAHVKFVPPQVAWFLSRFIKERDSVGDDIKQPGVTEHGYDSLPAVGVYEAPPAYVCVPVFQPVKVYPALTIVPTVGRLIAPLTQPSLVREGEPLVAPWLVYVMMFPHRA